MVQYRPNFEYLVIICLVKWVPWLLWSSVEIFPAGKIYFRSILVTAAAVALWYVKASTQWEYIQIIICTFLFLRRADWIKIHFPKFKILIYQIGLISLISHFCKERVRNNALGILVKNFKVIFKDQVSI